MAVSTAVLSSAIARARDRITDLFGQQCTHGAQTETMPDEFAACGQFIGTAAAVNSQRGLHGIAAALRVLGAASSAQSRELVRRLVTYCEASFGLNGEIAAESFEEDSKQNVIKLGELLDALSYIPPAAQVDAGALIRHVSAILQRHQIRNSGWGYFIGDDVPQLLPTAYAVRGLAQVGVDVAAGRRFVLDGLRSRSAPTLSTSADATTTIACAYCLAFYRSAPRDQEIKAAFASAWRVIESTFGEDLEQNLEYAGGGRNHYVRVPMQLYSLALACDYFPFRFATFRTQRRLNAVLDAIQQGAFAYPYSGRLLSSRTHAIAFDVLGTISDRLRYAHLLTLGYALDRVRTFLGSRWVRVPAAVCAAGFISYSVIVWSRTGRLEDLGPDLLASLFVLLMSIARR